MSKAKSPRGSFRAEEMWGGAVLAAPHDLVAQFNAGTQVRFGGNQRINRKQSVDEHSCGVARIIKFFHEGDPLQRLKLMEDAIDHDLGEGGDFGVGDLQYIFKIMHKVFARNHKKLEDIALAKIGITIEQTPVEYHWLKMADLLDAVAYMVRQLGAGQLKDAKVLAQIDIIYEHADEIPQHDLAGRIATFINALGADNQYQPCTCPAKHGRIGWFKRIFMWK